LLFWWYRFKNSATVRDIDLKFYMVVVFGKLEDPMQVFLAGTIHKYRVSGMVDQKPGGGKLAETKQLH
jgi:hypothetical protein